MDIAIIDKFLADKVGKVSKFDAAGIELLSAAADGVIRPFDLAGLTVSVLNADGRWIEVGGHLHSELKTLEVGEMLYLVVEVELEIGGNIYFVRVHRPDKDSYTVAVAKDY